MNSYTENQLIVITATINQAPSLGGAPISPSTIIFRMTTPDGAVTDLSSTVSNTGVGTYQAYYLPSQIGLHTYEWIGSTPAQVSILNNFMVCQATF